MDTRKFIINGNIVKTGTTYIDKDNGSTRQYQSDYNVGKLDYTVTGSFTQPKGGAGNSSFYNNYQVRMGDLYGLNRITVNKVEGVSLEREKNGTNTIANGIANPDFVAGYADQSDGYFFQNDGNVAKNAFYQVGGTNGYSGSITLDSSKAGHTAHVILANQKNGSTNYNVREYSSGVNGVRTSWGKLHLIMNGSANATQTFVGLSNGWAQATFTGGITVMSGTLRFNFNQFADFYKYKTSTNTTVSFFTKQVGGVATTTTHGDLRMEGGAFGSLISDSDATYTTYGAFRFTNLHYVSGKIVLRLKSATQVDSLDLTSYYQQSLDSTDPSNPVWLKVDGGTVTKEASSKITFDFGSSMPWWLLDDESGTFDINGGLGAKIIAWDSGKGAGLSASDFLANTYTQGDDYEAKFTVGDDGLYVKYMLAVIPEPASSATFASIFAALLAFYLLAWRKRK